MSKEKRKSTMNCTQVGEILTAYLDNEVTPEEKHEIELHLADCPNCRKELEELRFAQNILRRGLKSRGSDANPSPDLWPQFRLGLETQRPSFLFLFHRRKWRIIGTIIVLGIIITLAILWGTGILPGIRS